VGESGLHFRKAETVIHEEVRVVFVLV